MRVFIVQQHEHAKKDVHSKLRLADTDKFVGKVDIIPIMHMHCLHSFTSADNLLIQSAFNAHVLWSVV